VNRFAEQNIYQAPLCPGLRRKRMTKTTKAIIGILAVTAVIYTVIAQAPNGGLQKYYRDGTETDVIWGNQVMQILGLRKELHAPLGEDRHVDTIMFEFDMAYAIAIDDITGLMSSDLNDLPQLMGTVVKPRSVTLTLRGYDVR